jgi:hypothetical protein
MQSDKPTWRFALPKPPSTNNLYGSRIDRTSGKQRRHKTSAYKAWIDAAGWEMKAQGVGAPGYPALRQLLIEGVTGIDTDNIKAIPDLLKRMGIILDDKLIDRLVIERGAAGDKVTVSIWPI